MNDQAEALLEQIITKHDFVVKVMAVEACHSILVDFAGRKTVRYDVDVDDVDGSTYINGISYTNILEDELPEEYIPISTSSVRLYILLDIYRECRQLELPLEIIRFFAPQGEKVDYMKLFSFTLCEEDTNTEIALNTAINKVINQEVSPESLYDTLEQMNILHEFLILNGLTH